MARYTDPKCKLCRREGMKLFLKGEKCETEKCPFFRKQQAPGQHGTVRRRPSDYRLQLREKQKVKRIYGVLERQFRRHFKEASKEKEGAGVALLRILERRLDNVVYRLGMAWSRSHARQLVRHGKIKVSGKVVNTPSFEVEKGDKIEFAQKDLEQAREVELSSWLKWNKRKKMGEVVKLPEEDDLDKEINTQLIVGFYRR